ncbi:MAG: hypothetical protein HYV62_08035 [Candidatus Rokubacteria bacterium]|nr:hypothetical protein [Candidatus Rokubacteria bacterium]
MKVATVRQFRVGFFLPASGESVPLEAKRELFFALTDAIRSLMKRRRLSEESVVADFEKARAARRRR